MTPLAKHWVRHLPRGATLPQLFVVEGLGLCVVKFLENPQGPRALPNELIGFGLANLLGLDHPPVGVVHIPDYCMPHDGTLNFVEDTIYGGERFVFQPGLAFYSVWLDPKDEVLAEDTRGVSGAVNPEMLAGVVLLDLLLGNRDRKPRNSNLILHRERGRQRLKLIDLGMAFGSAVWELGDLQRPDLPPVTEPLPYSSPPMGLLNSVNPLTDFAPFLARLKLIDRAVVEEIVLRVPEQWGLDVRHRTALVNCILSRVAALPAYMETRLRSKTKKWWQ
jgi:hypothetical protein